MYGNPYRYRRRPTALRFIPALLLIVLSVLSILFLLSGKNDGLISPLADDFVPTRATVLTFFAKKKDPARLRTLVQTIVDSKWKNYSVYVVDLNSNFTMGINESTIFDAASVNKIPILVTLYHLVSAGKVNFSDTITTQAKDIQDYGTGSMRYDKVGTVYSIKTLARLMIQKSDNTAAYILANHTLGLSTIQSYIESMGTTQTDMTENTTSNRDISLLFRKMFAGDIANQALTLEMIGLLKDTDFEDRLPALLPENVVTYHKIGTGVGGVHDVGVVESGKMKYYIGVFTSDVTDEERASEEVAQVSKAVYEFMQ